MSCEKFSISSGCKVGRFPSFKVRSQDFRSVKSCLPVVPRSCSCVSCCTRESVLLQDTWKSCGVCGKLECGCKSSGICGKLECGCKSSGVCGKLECGCKSSGVCGKLECGCKSSGVCGKLECGCNSSGVCGKLECGCKSSGVCGKLECGCKSSGVCGKLECGCKSCGVCGKLECGCKSSGVCGKLECGCKSAGVCGKQVCNSFRSVYQPCSIQTSSSYGGVNTVIQEECRSPCGVSFPVNKRRCVCGSPDCQSSIKFAASTVDVQTY